MAQDWWAEHGRAFAEWVPGGVAVTYAVVHDAVAAQLSDKSAKRLAGAVVRLVLAIQSQWPDISPLTVYRVRANAVTDSPASPSCPH